jgi:predicted pyridoxine 5'-phosphate oxidase superfamily flavin-nucleotide-binding protein
MAASDRLVSLSTDAPIWDRFFRVAPLVLVGTLEEDGSPDLAPKHMAMPRGWENWFCFACSPRHATQRIELIGKLTGVPAVNVLDRRSDARLEAMLRERLAPARGDREQVAAG